MNNIIFFDLDSVLIDTFAVLTDCFNLKRASDTWDFGTYPEYLQNKIASFIISPEGIKTLTCKEAIIYNTQNYIKRYKEIPNTEVLCLTERNGDNENIRNITENFVQEYFGIRTIFTSNKKTVVEFVTSGNRKAVLFDDCVKNIQDIPKEKCLSVLISNYRTPYNWYARDIGYTDFLIATNIIEVYNDVSEYLAQ
jgi:hypothetical protein